MIFTAETTPGISVFVDDIQRYGCFFADTSAGVVKALKQAGNDDNADPNGVTELPAREVEFRGTVTVADEP